MDWGQHIELLRDISLKLLQKANDMLGDQNIDYDNVFRCLSESRKCVETALKFRLMTKSIEMEEELASAVVSLDDVMSNETPILDDDDDEFEIKLQEVDEDE